MQSILKLLGSIILFIGLLPFFFLGVLVGFSITGILVGLQTGSALAAMRGQNKKEQPAPQEQPQ